MIFERLATFTTSATATCTINGQPASCKDATGILAGFGIFLLIFGIYGLVSLVFWIVSLIHLIKHDDVPNRVMWILLIIFVPFGSWVYFFGPRRKYNKAHASAAPLNQNMPTNTPPVNPSVQPIVSPPVTPTPPVVSPSPPQTPTQPQGGDNIVQPPPPPPPPTPPAAQ